jgi:predicted Rossmann-fold nucleotide-binding protein
MQRIPIILYGTRYWRQVIDFDFLADEGVIRDSDLELFQYADSPEQAWKIIAEFHQVPVH